MFEAELCTNALKSPIVQTAKWDSLVFAKLLDSDHMQVVMFELPRWICCSIEVETYWQDSMCGGDGMVAGVHGRMPDH